MPLEFVTGDPLLTRCQVLAFGHNAKGRTELGHFETVLHDRHPAAFATYGKQCRNDRVKPGTLWLWRESQPTLGFMAVRETSVGATRLRYVEAILLELVRDYRLQNIQSVAFAPLGTSEEWPALRPVLSYWLKQAPFPCVVYERYTAGVSAE